MLKAIFEPLFNECANAYDWFRVIFRYYLRNPRFALIDVCCRLHYTLNSPFKICDNYNALFPESDVQCYGETPLKTLQLIASKAKIRADNLVYELGCGRGRGVFWLNSYLGCDTLGIDINPIFIHRAKRIKRWFSLKRVDFDQVLMHQLDCRGAEVIYLYGTSLSDEYIRKLVTHFCELASGTKIITVSYSLLEYGAQEHYEVVERFTGRFPWGISDIFVQVRS